MDEDLVHGSSLAATRLTPQRPSSTPVIFLNATCPFAQRAWIALLEKETPFEAVFEDLGNKSPAMCAAYKTASPEPDGPAKVPILVHEGRTMVESALVAKYVATAFQVWDENPPVDSIRLG